MYPFVCKVNLHTVDIVDFLILIDFLYLSKDSVYINFRSQFPSICTTDTMFNQKILSFLQSALLKQKDVQQFLHFRPSDGASESLDDSLLLLLKESYSPDSGSRYITKGLLFRIFRILSTQYDFSLSKEQKQTMNWIVFEEISDYIRAHFRDITIQDLVDEFHYQEDYFNRLIKRKTGLTYSAYVQQIRLERAEHLLVSTDKSIEEIADSVGYHNKGYFYKLFQEKYEETPASYRRHTR